MVRRLGILMLAVTTLLASTSICPRGVRACSVAPRASHRCCGHRNALGPPSCCSTASQAVPSQAGTVVGNQGDRTPLSPVASVLPAPTIPFAAPLARPSYCLPPPDTLFTRHTALLL